MTSKEPPFVATPRADCGPGGKHEPGIQGRVPASSASSGLSCNVSLISHQGTSGGFKTWRYIDESGRECAYYDTALLLPVNALKLDATSLGVAVVDMSDPRHPRQTATLTQLPMMSPHESLALNQQRGLIAAVLGNPATYPGLVSIYDAHKDCRHPELQSTGLYARFGHESGFSTDGNTFYATGTAVKAITAIDVRDPKHPHPVWHGQVESHGMSLSPDGNRGYIADVSGNMLTLDTSEIQARKPNPQAREISRLTWHSASIPQNAIPFTKNRHPYVLEFDEYTAGTTGGGDANAVGAGRIIDIANERKPYVLSNLRLQVNQPKDHEAAKSDPGAFSPVQGYAAHYCDVPTRVNPQVVACSFINSGLRIFDISDLKHPREIAYFVAPTKPRAENGLMASDFAMSKPSIIASRKEVWFTDGATGFYVVRVSSNVWPRSTSAKTSSCLSKRSPIGPRNIGRIRLGYTRKRLGKVPVAPTRRSHYAYRYCVRGRSGRVTAVFSGRSKRSKVMLVTTTAKGHGNRGVRVRSKARTFARAYPRRRRIAHNLFRASPHSPRLIGIRKGRVRFIAVAKPGTLANRRVLRRALRRAGL